MTDKGTGMEREFDLLTVGRSSIDLYANEVGAPFIEIKSFAAYVGGCPTNIAVSARRLGLRTALLNAVGEDLVGDFVKSFLDREGVETKYGVHERLPLRHRAARPLSHRALQGGRPRLRAEHQRRARRPDPREPRAAADRLG